MKKFNKKLITKICLASAALSLVSIPTIAVLTSCSSIDPELIPYTTTLTYDKDAVYDSFGHKGAYVIPSEDKAKIANCNDLNIVGPTTEVKGNNLVFQTPDWLAMDNNSKRVSTYNGIKKITLDYGLISSTWSTTKMGIANWFYIPTGVKQVIVKSNTLKALTINGLGTLAKLKVDVSQALSLETFGVLFCLDYQPTDLSLNTKLTKILITGTIGSFDSWDLSNNINLKDLKLLGCTNLKSIDLSKNTNLTTFAASGDILIKSLDFTNNNKINVIFLDKSISLSSVTLPSTLPKPALLLSIGGCKSLKDIKNIKYAIVIAYDVNSAFNPSTTSNKNITWSKD